VARQSRPEGTLDTHSPEQSRRLGRLLGAHAQPGDVILLRGRLGVGKTVLVQGLAEGLGVTGLVTSPSFTLVHEHAGRTRLYHLDLYRLRAADLPDIGIDDVFGAEAVVAIEWSEHLPPDLPRDALEVEIEFGEEADARRLRLSPRGPRSAALARVVLEEWHADTRP
jgi:tRNA threonylcarbamoyladenosine biosynthesis protein TsaE